MAARDRRLRRPYPRIVPVTGDSDQPGAGESGQIRRCAAPNSAAGRRLLMLMKGARDRRTLPRRKSEAGHTRAARRSSAARSACTSLAPRFGRMVRHDAFLSEPSSTKSCVVSAYRGAACQVSVVAAF